jgi:hypothetical protein
MGEMTLGGDELRTILILVALLGAGAVGALIHMRHEWRALRYKLFQPQDRAADWSRPGRVAERLDRGRLGDASREVLGRLRRDLESEGDADAAAAVESVAEAEERLAPLIGEVASQAMAAGELRSALVRLDRALVYVLVFPGRQEDRRAFRREAALCDGWQVHAAAIRDAAEGSGARPLVALLYFLGPDARDGTLLAAYEGDRGSRFAAELAESAGGPAGGLAVPTLSHEFALG